jgi:hypothetical protein
MLSFYAWIGLVNCTLGILLFAQSAQRAKTRDWMIGSAAGLSTMASGVVCLLRAVGMV